MKLKRLKVANWRGVSDLDVSFAEGVTLVTGRNEIGKSSMIEALTCLIEFPDSSASKRVKAIYPVHADLAPEVALEAELGPLRFTYAKRYKKSGQGGETTLAVEQPGSPPRQWTGRDAHDQAAELLRKHIDLDLWQALQIEQGSGIAQAALKDRKGLLAALDNAAGSESGLGSEDSVLVERVGEAYARYFTPKGKPRDRLAALPGEIASLAGEVDGLQQQLAGLEETADEHARLQRQRTGMQGKTARLRQQAEQAEAAWQSVNALAEQVDMAGLEAGNARLALERLESLQSERRQRVERVKALALRLEADDAELDGLERGIASTQVELDAANAVIAESTQALQESRQRHAKASAWLTLHGRRAELQALDQKLVRLKAIDVERREVQRVVDGTGVTEQALAVLQQLAEQVVIADAAVQAVSPEIEITAEQVLSLSIRDEDVSLDAGETRVESVNQGFEMHLPGVLGVRVKTTRDIAERLQALDQANVALADGLSVYGARSIGEARRQLARKQEAQAKLASLTERRNDLLDGDSEDGLHAQRARLDTAIEAGVAELAGVDLPAEEDELRSLIASEQSIHEELSLSLDARRADQQVLQSRLQELRVQRGSRRAGREAAGEQLDEGRQHLAEQRQRQTDQALEAAIQQAVGVMQSATAKHERLQQALLAADPEQAQWLAQNNAKVLTRHKDELQKLEMKIHEAEGRLSQARREGLFEKLEATQAALEHAQEELRRVTGRAGAARRLYELINLHRAAASRAYVQPLRDKVNALGRLVFDHTFSIEIDDALQIESRSLGGITVPFDSLSVGAREQVGILVRLAAVQLVSAEGPVPLLLDDSLGYADEMRLQSMGAAIARVGEEAQIIILTCMPERFTYIGNANTVLLG